MTNTPDIQTSKKPSSRHYWFNTLTTIILLLCLSWIMGVNMGLNALVDAENTVQRNVIYKNFAVHSRGTAKHGRGQTLTVYFEDGTQIETAIDVAWLAYKLSSLEQGTELSITLDASGRYLLGIQHDKETLMHETASVPQLNVRAWLSVIIGLVGFIASLAIIIYDIREERKHRTIGKQISQ